MESQTDDTAPHATPLKLRTPANPFGLYKVFRLQESQDMPHDPDHSILPEDLREQQTLPIEQACCPAPRSKLYPFPNTSSFRLGEWFWSDDTEKSKGSFQSLVSIVGSEDFNPTDIREANWAEIDRVLASSQYDVEDLDTKAWVDDAISWKSTAVTITVPFSKKTDKPGNYPFTVQGFHHRPLVPLIKAKLETSAGREYFHTLGHELRWNPGPGKRHVRVYGEMYNSPAFLEEYNALLVSTTTID